MQDPKNETQLGAPREGTHREVKVIWLNWLPFSAEVFAITDSKRGEQGFDVFCIPVIAAVDSRHRLLLLLCEHDHLFSAGCGVDGWSVCAEQVCCGLQNGSPRRSADSLESSEGNFPVVARRIETVLRMATIADFRVVNQQGDIVLLNGCQVVESAKFLGVEKRN